MPCCVIVVKLQVIVDVKCSNPNVCVIVGKIEREVEGERKFETSSEKCPECRMCSVIGEEVEKINKYHLLLVVSALFYAAGVVVFAACVVVRRKRTRLSDPVTFCDVFRYTFAASRRPHVWPKKTFSDSESGKLSERSIALDRAAKVSAEIVVQ